ncbi:catabolic alanine racemase DadX [Xenorhabdus szentirmaii]|uniref:Alanine racemase n=2 Tax=Xenorhabdus szentirmaii TaxID=290112 RepID=W1IU00_9GAMM|nr:MULTISPECIES: catabolic alanine racemase DadX [Xenorhabdus]MBD2779207.1 catabolic alanine racemase DadX [Xenorhabdus sp. 38]MBD2792657.1 catabolic alanine racemase DadX [Xenorhabdus sp. CUL]MBD2802580.1 catabolic alanine racemase DadX [Xenorhabdus sp. M]MBD2805765.1 catabolic alanine racemase DadX [Xenorhabdus sp. ZM]MBD2821315.1 catabolic alanine racemase DadX [Xenorhabdus sp. 42]
MPRPILATIHLNAFRHNLAFIRQRVSQSKIWSVVKANAYGHGLDRIWQSLAQTDGFALLDMNEAIYLREQGWQGPILLLEGFFKPSDLQIINQYHLTTVVHSQWQLEEIEKAEFNTPVDIYLKLNSGMNRLGFSSKEYPQIVSMTKKMKNIGSVTLMTHFANSDNEVGIEAQLAVVEGLQLKSLPHCLANSGGVLWHPEAHGDWVRPGIILYGASPSGKWRDIADTGLKPTMTLQSELIAVHELSAGDRIGYGSRYTAQQPMRVGTVACGYADGYPRHASTGTPVIVDGIRTRLLGAISMDMLSVDLTPCPQAKVGSKVELWGGNLPVDEVAESAGTIGYELLCALAKRVPVIVD